MAETTKNEIHLPAGGVALFGKSGSGKSSFLYNSEYVRGAIVADTGSLSHRLYFRGVDADFVVIDPMANDSPITQVQDAVKRFTTESKMFFLDSYTTLQEQQVAWTKKNAKRGFISLPDHQAIVGQLRDLALVLSRASCFTVFNSTPGGEGKTPDGQRVVYPAGAVTGYPSLSGTEAGKETILARWSSVWGFFAGFRNDSMVIPRGMYVPGQDIRPESHAIYSPLKDPMMVIENTSPPDSKPIFCAPDLRSNLSISWVDMVLAKIANKWPKKKNAK